MAWIRVEANYIGLMRLVMERNRPSLRMSVGSGFPVVYLKSYSLRIIGSVFGKDVFDSEEDRTT